MELCAIPSIQALDINSLIMHSVDPDMPYLSSRESILYADMISTLIKNKFNGLDNSEFYDTEVGMVADLMCDNINQYVSFRYVEKVIVCLETGECLIEGVRHEY